MARDPFDEWKEWRMLEAQTEAAANAERVRAETQALRHEIERQESRRQQAEAEAAFGTIAFNISCLKRAIALNPVLKATFTFQYSMLLRRELENLKRRSSSPGATEESIIRSKKRGKSLCELVASRFSPLPKETVKEIENFPREIDKCLDQLRTEWARQRKQTLRRLVLFGFYVLLIVFLVWAAIRLERHWERSGRSSVIHKVKPAPPPARVEGPTRKRNRQKPRDKGRKRRKPDVRVRGGDRDKNADEMTVEELENWLRRDDSPRSEP